MSHGEKNWLEWVVFGAGALITCAVIAFLAVDGVRSMGGRAELQARVADAMVRGEAHGFEIVVENRGERGAEMVRVEVKAGDATSELELDRVPRRTSRSAWATFPRAVLAGEVTVRIVSFQER